MGKLLAFCVAGHHAGLANGVNGERITALRERIEEDGIPEIDDTWKDEIALPGLTDPGMTLRSTEYRGFSLTLLCRMIFSALVDADYLDTEAYYDNLRGHGNPRGEYPSVKVLAERASRYLDNKELGSDITPLNDLRRRVLQHVREQAPSAQGVFTLTVPTGGGKTLISLAFALEHALTHGLRRVIYVIPYTSIVEQTARVFRDALRQDDADPADFVLEHHSAFDAERMGSREGRDKLGLAMENWDVPVVVTTAVQFFESLFANRTSRCRKLHNIANSVVILDEAQTLPLKYSRPCVAVLDELARNWNTTIVLCTATQPALRDGDFPGGFEETRELAPDPEGLYRAAATRRTQLVRAGTLDDAELAQRLRAARQTLCIVNTRRHARELYESIRDDGGACHLTTSMCAAHRADTLARVRRDLENEAPVRLIATSLVEAGVDVDFAEVWRAEAGLESMIQAAGRCNREGRSAKGNLFVFTPAEAEGRQPPPAVAQFADVARAILRQHEDPFSLDAIHAYFRKLYQGQGEALLDRKGILKRVREQGHSLDFPFETIADEFRLIETDMVPVIVPYAGSDGADERCSKTINDLRFAPHVGTLARRLQPYVVQIHPDARAALVAAGSAEVLRGERYGDQFVHLTNMDLYDPDVGLKWQDPTFRNAETLMA